MGTKKLCQWFSEYGESHQNLVNQAIHKVAVPLILFSVLGLLWSIPFPIEGIPFFLNWASVAAVFCFGFYARLSPKLCLGIIAIVALQMAILSWLDLYVVTPVWVISIVIFVLSWVLQFIGHHVEGKKPSFFKDLQFLLIGPIWVLAMVYRKVGLDYESN
jgi:uncharacterized membrane protein YGL010W